MRRSNLIWLCFGFFTLMLCLGLIVCSSSPALAAVQGLNGKVITVGISNVMSGPMAAYSAIGNATKIYLDMVNRKGGVNGYTFKYVERDNANQPAQAASAAQQLVNRDKVFALVSVATVPTQAIVADAASLKLPVIAYANGDLYATIPNFFGSNPRYTQAPLFEVQYLIKDLGLKKIAYVYPDDASGRPALDTLPNFVKNNGAELVAMLPFAATTTDWAPFATKLQSAGVEGFAYFSGALMPSLLKANDAIGYKPKIVGNFGTLSPSFLRLAGPLAEGVYCDSHMEPIDAPTPEVQLFRDEMKAAGQEANIGTPAGQGWTGGAALVEGVRRATANGAPLTWDSFMKAMLTFKNLQVGIYPSVTYTPDAHHGVTQSAIYQVQSGKFVRITPMSDIPVK